MSFFNPDYASPLGSPQSMMDILISPLLFAFFGVMIFIGAVRYQMTYDKEVKWWKWCFAPLGLATLFGIQRIAFMSSFGYVQTVTSRKLLLAHYFSLIIPVVCIAAIIAYNFLKKRNEGRRVY